MVALSDKTPDWVKTLYKSLLVKSQQKSDRKKLNEILNFTPVAATASQVSILDKLKEHLTQQRPLETADKSDEKSQKSFDFFDVFMQIFGLGSADKDDKNNKTDKSSNDPNDNSKEKLAGLLDLLGLGLEPKPRPKKKISFKKTSYEKEQERRLKERIQYFKNQIKQTNIVRQDQMMIGYILLMLQKVNIKIAQYARSQGLDPAQCKMRITSTSMNNLTQLLRKGRVRAEQLAEAIEIQFTNNEGKLELLRYNIMTDCIYNPTEQNQNQNQNNSNNPNSTTQTPYKTTP